MDSKELNDKLIRSFPELENLYRDEVSWQEGDNTGSHIVFGDVFTPFLEKSINEKSKNNVESSFLFIEEILKCNDKYSEEVIVFSVLENLVSIIKEEPWIHKYIKVRTKHELEHLGMYLIDKDL